MTIKDQLTLTISALGLLITVVLWYFGRSQNLAQQKRTVRDQMHKLTNELMDLNEKFQAVQLQHMQFQIQSEPTQESQAMTRNSLLATRNNILARSRTVLGQALFLFPDEKHWQHSDLIADVEYAVVAETYLRMMDDAADCDKYMIRAIEKSTDAVSKVVNLRTYMMLLCSQGRFDEAMQITEKALNVLDGSRQENILKNIETGLMFGQSAFAMGKFDIAETMKERALKIASSQGVLTDEVLAVFQAAYPFLQENLDSITQESTIAPSR